jgi:uncharacterized membrane protein YhaH (DUF805 family)
MQWYLKALRNYARFGGRASRTEYWMFILIHVAFSVVLMILDKVIGTDYQDLQSGLLSGLYALATLIPMIAVTVRRFHDSGRSGWLICILFALIFITTFVTQLITFFVSTFFNLLFSIGNVALFQLFVNIFPFSPALIIVIYYFYILIVDSQPGANKYGDHPKEQESLMP